MGAAQCPRPDLPRTAADQRRHGGRVVRRLERRPGDQRGARRQRARDRVDGGDLERGPLVQRREQAGQPLGEHGLARPRADRSSAGGARRRRPPRRHAVRPPDPRRRRGRGAEAAAGSAAADVPGAAPSGRPGDRPVRPACAPAAPRSGRRGPPPRRSAAGTTTCAVPGRRGREDGRQHAADGPHRAVEAQLAEEHQPVDRRRGTRCPPPPGHAAASARSKPLPCLGIDGRRQPDGDPPQRELAARVGDGGADPVDRLPHDGVGKADEDHARAARWPCRPRPRPSPPGPRPDRPTRCGPASQERRPQVADQRRAGRAEQHPDDVEPQVRARAPRARRATAGPAGAAGAAWPG